VRLCAILSLGVALFFALFRHRVFEVVFDPDLPLPSPSWRDLSRWERGAECPFPPPRRRTRRLRTRMASTLTSRR
jgi:hypothetical protein